jgi:uncharacterized protein
MTRIPAAGMAVLALLAAAGCNDGDTPRVVAASGSDAELRTITGTGTGRVRSRPDTMTIDIGVDTRAETAQEALTRNSGKATMVFADLREAGVEERDVQTSNLSVSPEYDDEGMITGYEVTNSVTATLRDLDKAGAVIDAAAAVAGDDIRVHGVYFSIEDTSDLVTAARAEAVKEARAEADQLAEAAGLELAGVVSIEETGSPMPPPVVLEDEAGGERASTPINPGSQELTVDVVVRFAIG